MVPDIRAVSARWRSQPQEMCLGGGTTIFRVLLFVCCASLWSKVSAQVVTNGTIAVAGGGAFLDGDQPAFQQRMRQRKDGYGGVENFSWSRTTENDLLCFDLRAMPGNEDYLFSGRWEKFDGFYVEANRREYYTHLLAFLAANIGGKVAK